MTNSMRKFFTVFKLEADEGLDKRLSAFLDPKNDRAYKLPSSKIENSITTTYTDTEDYESFANAFVSDVPMLAMLSDLEPDDFVREAVLLNSGIDINNVLDIELEVIGSAHIHFVLGDSNLLALAWFVHSIYENVDTYSVVMLHDTTGFVPVYDATSGLLLFEDDSDDYTAILHLMLHKLESRPTVTQTATYATAFWHLRDSDEEEANVPDEFAFMGIYDETIFEDARQPLIYRAIKDTKKYPLLTIEDVTKVVEFPPFPRMDHVLFGEDEFDSVFDELMEEGNDILSEEEQKDLREMSKLQGFEVDEENYDAASDYIDDHFGYVISRYDLSMSDKSDAEFVKEAFANVYKFSLDGNFNEAPAWQNDLLIPFVQETTKKYGHVDNIDMEEVSLVHSFINYIESKN